VKIGQDQGRRDQDRPTGLLGALAEGPARLPADQVAASQRRRLLAAMVAAVAEKGYVGVAVADVVGRAHVSRASFYEQFADKSDCFLAAYRACADHLVGDLRHRVATDAPARRRLHGLLANYLGALAAFPEGARVFLVETHAAGPAAARQRRQIQLDFVGLLRDLHRALADGGEPVRPLDDFAFEALVAAISSLATSAVAVGDPARLGDLLGPIETFVLTHFGLDADDPDDPDRPDDVGET
jgi:TetR/AcrR family transcriptional regulator